MFDWITQFFEATGYFGIALLMFLENVFPPIPSEVIMPLAGFHASQQGKSLVLAILSGSLGSLAGATFWYGVGRWVGEDRLAAFAGRHGRWLTMTPAEVRRADDWFDERAEWAVLIGRVLPGLRTLISVPAGLFEMPIGRFLVFSGIGTLLWTSALTGAGYLLGENYTDVQNYLNPASNVIIGVMVLGYIWRVIRWKPEG